MTEAAVERVLRRVGEDGPSSDGAPQAVGQTESGRYLRVVDVPDEDGDGLFVVTTYPLADRGEDEWIAADEASAPEDGDQAVVTVPMSLLPEVRRLLATHKTS